jgi:hypothetical protein
MKQKRFMHHESDNALEHQIGQLVENRPYEISVTAKGRAGESRPSRTLTISPAAKSNNSNSKIQISRQTKKLIKSQPIRWRQDIGILQDDLDRRRTSDGQNYFTVSHGWNKSGGEKLDLCRPAAQQQSAFELPLG